ncbi:hypothetical protein GGG16DRAFT_58676 [Schizophyllum commune]
MTSPLSPAQFNTVFDTIRIANLRTRRSAHSTRAAHSPTHRAHARARTLRLAVDVTKAANCPQSQISINPLPIIDTSASPSSSASAQSQAPPPACSAVAQPRPTSPPLLRRRPALKCVIPASGLPLDDEFVTVLLSTGSPGRRHMWRTHKKSATISDFRREDEAPYNRQPVALRGEAVVPIGSRSAAPRLSIDISPSFSVEEIVSCVSDPGERSTAPLSRPTIRAPPATDRPRADVPVDVVEDAWEGASLFAGYSMNSAQDYKSETDYPSPTSALTSVMTLSSTSSSFGDLICSPRGTTWYSSFGVAPASAASEAGSLSSSQSSAQSENELVTPENTNDHMLKRKSFQAFECQKLSKCARLTY